MYDIAYQTDAYFQYDKIISELFTILIQTSKTHNNDWVHALFASPDTYHADAYSN